MKDLGITQTLGVFLSVLLSFPMGLLIDQFGPKWVMSSGFAIYAIAALCFTCSFDYLSLSVAMTLFGIAQIAALLPMTAMVFQYCAPDQRGQIFSFVQFVRAFSAFLISLLLGSIVQLSPSYEPTPFYPSDIKEIAGLESDLLSPKNDAARYIRDHLSKESNMLLSQPPSDALRISLIADLNKLLKEPVLYTPARFQLIFLSQQSRQLIEQPTPNSSEGSIVSNRVLIQDIFPNELSKKFNYRLPFEVSLIVALIAMVAALISRPGKFTKSS
jgi:MFS family permease